MGKFLMNDKHFIKSVKISLRQNYYAVRYTYLTLVNLAANHDIMFRIKLPLKPGKVIFSFSSADENQIKR